MHIWPAGIPGRSPNTVVEELLYTITQLLVDTVVGQPGATLLLTAARLGLARLHRPNLRPATLYYIYCQSKSKLSQVTCASCVAFSLNPRKPQQRHYCSKQIPIHIKGDNGTPSPRLLNDIHQTPAWRDFLIGACELSAVDLQPLIGAGDQRLVFFLNLYNLIVLHATVALGPAQETMDRIAFYKVCAEGRGYKRGSRGVRRRRVGNEHKDARHVMGVWVCVGVRVGLHESTYRRPDKP